MIQAVLLRFLRRYIPGLIVRRHAVAVVLNQNVQAFSLLVFGRIVNWTLSVLIQRQLRAMIQQPLHHRQVSYIEIVQSNCFRLANQRFTSRCRKMKRCCAIAVPQIRIDLLVFNLKREHWCHPFIPGTITLGHTIHFKTSNRFI